MNEQWLSAAEVLRAVRASLFVLEVIQARMDMVVRVQPWYRRPFPFWRGPLWRKMQAPRWCRDQIFWTSVSTKYRLYRLASKAEEAVDFLETATIPISVDEFIDIRDQFERA